MKNNKVITVLGFAIFVLAVAASNAGIFSKNGPGSYEYESIRGKTVTIYGKGFYQHMSADVAVQGIAQDYVTLFLASPLLLAALFFARKGSLKWRFILAGILNYFLVTYLMYLEIAMYNPLFLIFVALLGTSFFAFSLVLLSFDVGSLPSLFREKTPVKLTGGFLIFNSIVIALLWLSVVVPPLLDGTIYPEALQHYTTLTVQGLDLALFLPVSFVAGWLVIRKNPYGYLLTTVTLVFLPLLMTALTAKIIAMAMTGVNVIPAVFVIPAIWFMAVICSSLMIRNIR